MEIEDKTIDGQPDYSKNCVGLETKKAARRRLELIFKVILLVSLSVIGGGADLLQRDYFPVSAIVRADTAKDTLFLKFLDISIDITPINANRICHFLSCGLRVTLN